MADSGKYKVIAVNAGGESQSIADFLVLEPEVSPEQLRKVSYKLFELSRLYYLHLHNQPTLYKFSF